MKKMIPLFYLLIFIHATAQAGTGSGKVLELNIRAYDNLMLVKVENYVDSCTNWNHQFGMPINTETGKAIYSLLLSAKMSGKEVHIQGTGSCNGPEGISEVNMKK